MKLERDAFYAMLGIAMRAGQLSLGESGVLKTVSSGTALFMILDADASDNTKKKLRGARWAKSCWHWPGKKRRATHRFREDNHTTVTQICGGARAECPK